MPLHSLHRTRPNLRDTGVSVPRPKVHSQGRQSPTMGRLTLVLTPHQLWTQRGELELAAQVGLAAPPGDSGRSTVMTIVFKWTSALQAPGTRGLPPSTLRRSPFRPDTMTLHARQSRAFWRQAVWMQQRVNANDQKHTLYSHYRVPTALISFSAQRYCSHFAGYTYIGCRTA